MTGEANATIDIIVAIPKTALATVLFTRWRNHVCLHCAAEGRLIFPRLVTASSDYAVALAVAVLEMRERAAAASSTD